MADESERHRGELTKGVAGLAAPPSEEAADVGRACFIDVLGLGLGSAHSN